MTSETPVEMLHLPQELRKVFGDRVPQAIAGTEEQREADYVSRAIAAMVIHKLGGASLDEAVQSLVDGGGDGGIDAVFYLPAAHTLWVVQAKFIRSGRGEPDLGAVTKFKAGVENLLQGDFEGFRSNAAWVRLIPQLEHVFRDGSLQIRVVLAYSGINLVSEDRRRLFEDLKRRFSPGTDYLEVQICNLTTIHDWLTGADQGPGVPEVELTLHSPGWVREPYETVFGLVALDELAVLFAKHGRQLIAANIRGYKGKTDVNEQIASTVRDEPDHFFYLNNGLTAYCARLDVHNLDRANAERKRITAFGLSIINGAQTLGVVAESLSQRGEPVRTGHVFVKVISLARCPDERALAERITRSTNFQNQIGARDFASLDEEQERIANQLVLAGVNYHYKQDVDVPPPDESNFTLEEATTACACLAQQEDCDFVSRVLSDRKSLWSFESGDEPAQSRYRRVFRSDRSARTVWRAVQTQRLVIQSMQENARASGGVRKAFFENARWLVLNAVFLILHPERGDGLMLEAGEQASIRRIAVDVAELLFGICEAQGFLSRRADAVSGTETYEQARHFRSVFCSASDCRALRRAFLAKLAGDAVKVADVAIDSQENQIRAE